MPDPQPAWAQQYNLDMQPAWARKFEPPSITGGESHGVMRSLIRIYRETGEKKYIETLPNAIAYLKKSARPDGRLARFYELTTNKPLYFTKDYQLTYSDADMPTHYAFIVSNNLDRVERELAEAQPLTDEDRARGRRPRSFRLTSQLEKDAQQTIAALDAPGRWLEKGSMRNYGDDDPTTQIIDCRTFINRIEVLSQYLAAAKASR